MVSGAAMQNTILSHKLYPFARILRRNRTHGH